LCTEDEYNPGESWGEGASRGRERMESDGKSEKKRGAKEREFVVR